MPLLEVQHLQKIYTTRFGGDQVQALTNVNFSVEPGEYVAIMGESGSGKTTLLNILAALDRPTSRGGVSQREGPLRHPGAGPGGLPPVPPGVRVPGLQPAGHLLPPGQHLSAPGAGGHGLPGDAPPAPALAEQLGIADILTKYPYEVSGGQKQRAAVARALITGPQIVLADEPTGALDSRSSDALLDLFGEINDGGQTILMVTHSVKAASHAGRVLFLRDGQVYHQLYRGGESREAQFRRISDTLTVLAGGGEGHA